MLALAIFQIIIGVFLIYMITVLQDIRDLLDIVVSPFLYENDSPTFDKLDKSVKQRGKQRAKKALKRKG